MSSLAAVVLSGCATQAINGYSAFQPIDLNPQVKAGKLVQKTNSFFVVNDSSSSMSRTYLGSADYKGTKLDVEKDLLNKFNKSIPNIPLSSGVLNFGYGSCLNWSDSQLVQPIEKYSPNSFDAAINSLQCSSGGTPLAEALQTAKQTLGTAPGNIALIVLSDGMGHSSAIPNAEALAEQFGDRLCIYPVWVGNPADTQGRENLEQIAKTSSCGAANDAVDLASAQGVSNFVKQVFFKEGNTGLEADDDQDGVPNSKDKCPDTPRGAIVDRDGCWTFHSLLFDFDSDKIKSSATPAIQNAVHVLKLNPGLTAEIQGHTDGIGSVSYNLKLSERRALSVKRELINQGIEGKRLTTHGFGKSEPVASNDTEEGRAYNRRVTYKRTDR